MGEGAAIALAVVLLVLNAFFVGAEFGIISARRSSIEPLAAAGSRAARTTLTAMEDISSMLACAQLGVTVCSLGLGAVGEPAIAHLLERPFDAWHLPGDLVHPLAFALALVVVVLAHVVLGEVVPKNLALAGPDRAALALTPVLAVLAVALRPVIVVTNWTASSVLRVVGIESKDEVTSTFTREEVADLVEESHREGLLEEDEERLALGALAFADRTAASVVLPLATLTTLPLDARVSAVQEASARTGYSRFPLTAPAGGDARALVGYVHVKDVLTLDPAARAGEVPRRYVRALATVSADDGLRAVLRRMQDSGSHLARVVDAQAVLLGIAALEDVLEELVGQVRSHAPASAAPTTAPTPVASPVTSPAGAVPR